MIQPFNEIHRLLHGDLRPAQNSQERFFRDELQKPAGPNPEEVGYSIAFPPALNHKTMWYHRHLTRTTNDYCHYLTHLIGSEEEESVRYWLKTQLLDRTLPSLLKQTGDILADKGYTTKLLTTPPEDADKEHQSSLYIYQLAKVCLAKCFLTAQELLADLVENQLTEADIYRILVGEWGEPLLCLSPVATESNKEAGKPGEKIGFTYIHLTDHADYLNDFCDSLKKAKMIDQTTALKDFKKLFMGKPVSVPVRWTGGVGELYFLIVLLHNDRKLVKELGVHELWDTACRCFVTKSGEPYNKANLRKGKRPNKTADTIETCVGQLTD